MGKKQKRRLAGKRAAQTRWLYHAEKKFLNMRHNKPANEDLPMDALRRFARRVWRNEAPKGRRMPDIVASQGVWDRNAFTSCCWGWTDIELARHHRTKLVTLHELAHAVGIFTHGERFVRFYFHLLNKYAGFNWFFLQGLAAERNIWLWNNA